MAPTASEVARWAGLVGLAVVGLGSVPRLQTPPAERAPGLIARFESGTGDAAVLDARVTRMVALFVADGVPATPFMAPGPFRVTWRGELEIRFRDRFVFSSEGNGELELFLDGKPVALGARSRLSRGFHRLEVRYAPPARGEARVRLLWSGSDFGAEPLPPERLSHAPSDSVLRTGSRKRRGRELIARLHCAKCHMPPQAVVLAENAMPEMGRDGPMLTGIGERLRREWLERWVLDPRAVRPGATMPRVLHGNSAPQDARDIAGYLASLGTPARAVSFAPKAAYRGGVLFAQLGCVGCHTRASVPADAERLALGGVGQKWHTAALIEFLRDPARHYEWIEMPNFGLDESEARDLVAFLLSDSERASPRESGAGDVGRGQELVQNRGCLKCHFVGEIGRFRGPRWEEISRFDHGCLAATAAQRGSAPDFGFDGAARADLAAAWPEWESLGRCAPAEFATRHVRAQRCDACHERDGAAARWSAHAAEVESLLVDVEPPALAQHRPSLTWAGGKLRTEWTAALLRGEVAEPPRPWLRARMPAFATGATALAAGLAAQHGYGPAAARGGDPDPAQVALGGKLIGAEGGFACVLCHALGDRAPVGVFEVQGTNFATTVERLRKPFFHRWMSNPLRIDPASRMPKYTDGRGKTGFADVLDGDGHRQFEAMWQYLRTLK